jgi:hypothetical protein
MSETRTDDAFVAGLGQVFDLHDVSHSPLLPSWSDNPAEMTIGLFRNQSLRGQIHC